MEVNMYAAANQAEIAEPGVEDAGTDWRETLEERGGDNFTGGHADEDSRTVSGEPSEWPEDTADLPEDEEDFEFEERREADQSFTLKHLGQVRTVSRDEVIALAQKGLDYDRQRQKNDELTAKNHTLTSEAAARAEALALPGEIPRPVKTPDEAAAAKRSADIREFLAEYSDVDPKAIPGEVWQGVAAGKTLLSAYQSWELKRLRAENQISVKNAENKEKTAGSRQTAGNSRQRDPITADWYS